MNAPLEFLLDENSQTTRQRRQPRGTWHQIHPPTLLEKYNEPELALAAAIVQITAEDIRTNNNRRECFAFLKSEWFSLIARGLDFHPDTMNALELS